MSDEQSVVQPVPTRDGDNVTLAVPPPTDSSPDCITPKSATVGCALTVAEEGRALSTRENKAPASVSSMYVHIYTHMLLGMAVITVLDIRNNENSLPSQPWGMKIASVGIISPMGVFWAVGVSSLAGYMMKRQRPPGKWSSLT